jgi:hypothetical protein
MGFKGVASSPLARSSFREAELYGLSMFHPSLLPQLPLPSTPGGGRTGTTILYPLRDESFPFNR